MSPFFPRLQLDRPLAVLDLETTALAVPDARIVEIGVVKLHPVDRPLRFSARVDPSVPIPPAATTVHGLRDADVRGRPTFADLAADLDALLGDADLAGFNVAAFDLPVLVREFRRAGREFPLAGRAVVDVLALFHRLEPRDLAAAVRKYLGRDHPGAHSAGADARAAAEVLDAQLARHPELPRRPTDLHRLLVEVDVGRRFRRRTDGAVVLGFGRHAGTPLAEVAARDPGYLRWLLGTDLLDDAKAVLRDALAGPTDRTDDGSDPRSTRP